MRLRFYWLEGLYPSPWHDGNLGLEHRGRYLVHCEWHLGQRDLEISCRVGGQAAMVGGRAYRTVTWVVKIPRIASVYLSACLPAWVATRCRTERTLGVQWHRAGLWWDVWTPATAGPPVAAWRKGRGRRQAPGGPRRPDAWAPVSPWVHRRLRWGLWWLPARWRYRPCVTHAPAVVCQCGRFAIHWGYFQAYEEVRDACEE